MSVPEALEQAVETGDNKLTAIYIAVLAVLLAICSISDDDASKTAVRANIQAADTYAFFQAKNIRQTDYEIATDLFEAQLKNPALNAETRNYLNERISAYRARVARYDSEPATGEGKKELLEKARRLEAERDLALSRDPYFDLGQGLLQIAIVLASVSLIIGGSFMLIVSAALGTVGTLSMINAFLLVVQVPFLT
ncbi:MAG: DUF4337 domain-containing protein [Rhodomicrobiaceae bacterium]